MPNDEVLVSFGSGKQVFADHLGFRLMTDQPPQAGGEGAAPQPYTLFLASIATCAGGYVLGFCQSRNLPTEGIRLRQRMRFGDDGVLCGVELDIEVPPHFPARYHDALVRVADRCAVKKAIAAGPEFEVRTVVSAPEVESAPVVG